MKGSITDKLQSPGFAHIKDVLEAQNAQFLCQYLLDSFSVEHTSLFSHPDFKDTYTPSNPFPTYNLNAVREMLSADPCSYAQLYTIWGMTSVESRISIKFLSKLLSHKLISKLSISLYGSVDPSLPIYMHCPPSVRVIYPGNTVSYVPNHADCQYNSFLISNHTDSNLFPFLTCWIPLQGSSLIHGGLHVYPSTYHTLKNRPLAPHRGWIHDTSNINEDLKLLIDYDLRDVVIFNPFLYHGSSPNLSTDSDLSNFRVSIDFRFFGKSTSTTKHYLDVRTLKIYDPFTGPCSGHLSNSGN